MTQSVNSLIESTIDGNIAILKINNPPANTWTKESLGQLKSIIATLNDNSEVYSLVITGEGNKFFS